MQNSPCFPTLEVNLAAIVRNYGRVCEQLTVSSSCETPKAAAQDLMRSRALPSGQPRDDGKKRAGAVVKANAYGLGAARIAPVLYDAGCRNFFVATLDEAIEVRAVVPEGIIYVFHGARKSQTRDFLAHRLTPVLNCTEQVKYWDNAGPWALHIDTGMCRLGIAPEQAEEVAAKGKPAMVMSHLACASAIDHPKNKEQFELFKQTLRHFPGVTASFANSSGVFLNTEYHFDLVRPGRALYGITRGTKMPANLENVVELSAPVLQYRTVKKPETVGYNATTQVGKGTVLATLEMGYADGFVRALSHKIQGFAHGVRLPVVGLISMDMIIVDVTHLPEHLRTDELRVTLIGEAQPIDLVADAACTIGYEIFTRLGSRVRKIYK